MSSTNDSIADQRDMSSDFNQESLPTPTTLLNRKGLFGNSAALLSTSYNRDATPEPPNSADGSSVNEAVETNGETSFLTKNSPSETVLGKTSNCNNEESEIQKEVGEECERKIISMDTAEKEDSRICDISTKEKINDDTQILNETDHCEEKDENIEEDDEDEVPRKRPKRTDPIRESHEDDQEEDEEEEGDENFKSPSPENPDVVETVPHNQEIEEVIESNDGSIDISIKSGRRTRSRCVSNGNESITENDEDCNDSTETNSKPNTKYRRGRSSISKPEKKPEELEENSIENEIPVRRTRRSQNIKNDETGKEAREKEDLSTESKLSDSVAAKSGKRRRNSSTKADEKVVSENLSNNPSKISANEESQNVGRRSTRVKSSAANTPKPLAATPKTRKTPSSAKRGKKVMEEEEEMLNNGESEVVVEIEKNSKSGKAKKTPKAVSNTSSKSYSETNTIAEYDPYDMDTEMEKHPEPLKNIHMQVQNFGSVKYAKIGNSASKYTFTEKAAESRINNLLAVTPQRKERRSLAEMTPGKEKIQHKSTGILPTSAKRSRTRKVDDLEEEEDIEITTSVSSKRGRKRTSELDIVSSENSKKTAQVLIPQLSEEEQWKVDHPEDEHEPHGPGARVYANFDKIFYPAIIATERDGLGRFKVQFTADKIIKDVPSAGIIPIRAVVAGKQCFFNDDVVNVIACPNAASATEWSKGIFEVEILDDDGDGSGETKSAEWTEFSLDMNDWKEYINMKSSQATSIVTDNITTPSEMQRAARKKATPIAQTKKTPTNKFSKQKREDSENPKRVESNGSEEDTQLQMNKKGIGKNIFKGKMFILTSANRQSSSTLPLVLKKKVLQDFLESNGGTVTENFSDVDSNNELEALLISDTHYRTHKYLAALARSMPCVSNQWVLTCAEEGVCVDYTPYRLPAGISIFDGELYPAPEDPKKLLAGKTFYVHSTHNIREVTNNGLGATFIDIWKPIITLLGGDVKDVTPEEIIGQTFDILLTDATYREDVWKAAEDCGAHICTSEWIIQTIILGSPPSFESHEKFHPSFLTRRREERLRGKN